MPADLASLVANLAFVDEMYRVYRRDPAAVDPSWRTLFENGAWVAAAAAPAPAGAPALDAARFAGVWTLVNAYRVRGHLEADLDPLGMLERERHPDLDPRTYGFTDADLDRVVPSPARFDVTAAPLRELLFRLRATWCGPVGLEFMHIPAPQKKAWLIDRME